MSIFSEIAVFDHWTVSPRSWFAGTWRGQSEHTRRKNRPVFENATWGRADVNGQPLVYRIFSLRRKRIR